MRWKIVWPWHAVQLRSGVLPKKDPINFLQHNVVHLILNERRLLENIKNVAKTSKKEHLVDAITSCLSAKFKAKEMVEEVKKLVKAKEIHEKTKEVNAQVVDEGGP
ncbi:peptidyl-prolyl cis-trans isomerase FKBP3-like [Stigmatopora nigra]